MADEGKNSTAVAWLGVASVLAMLLLALAALKLATHPSATSPAPLPPQITITNASNNTQDAVEAPAAARVRPDKPDDASAHRGGQQQGAPRVLPGPPYDAQAARGRRAVVLSNPQRNPAPPYYMTAADADHVMLRVRGLPTGAGNNFKGPVPFRIRNWNAGADGRVSSIEARVPAAENDEAFSYLPEVAYKASSGHGPKLQISLENPRKTSAVNALRAPKGFQFFVAEISAKNLGGEPISIEPDIFEVQDSDGVPYLPNPELLSADFPQAPIGSQSAAKFTAAFLVPADASLVALIAREPGDGLISSPLTPQ